MNTSEKKLPTRLAVAGGLALGLMVASAGTASADVSVRDSYPKDQLHCGGQHIVTGQSGWGPATIKQHSWIYYNCGDTSTHVKAVVNNGVDGDCIGVGPGEALVLQTIWAPILFTTYEGSEHCS